MLSIGLSNAAFLSTPSGWRATPPPQTLSRLCPISIHALRVEGDTPLKRRSSTTFLFLSTPSGWRATGDFEHPGYNDVISIHALRVEGDTLDSCSYTARKRFLSTPSGWRATSSYAVTHSYFGDFYPRPPGGGRLVVMPSLTVILGISIHALRVEGDVVTPARLYSSFIFLSTPSGWRATCYGAYMCRF